MTDLVQIDQAIAQGADIDTVERLMVLRREIESQEARKFFQADFSRLQAVLPSVQKTGRASFKTKQGGKMSYGYVKVDDLTDALKPYMIQYGFSFTFRQKELHDKIGVQCVVMHIAGHREVSEMTAPLDTSGHKSHLQAMASTISYLKRITFISAFGIATTDKDVPKAPIQANTYTDLAFMTHFPRWRLLIESGQKTPLQILSFLESKNINLTQSQKQDILECGC